MTHFGIICPPYPGHINPLAALGRELQSRGHRVTFLQIPDVELKVRSEGLNFYPIGQSLYQPGLLAETFQQIAKLSEIEALRYSVDFCRLVTEIICQDAPSAIAATGIEALLVDQLEPVGETIAQYLEIPFICISSGQAIHRRADVPPFFTPWSYQNTWWARLRNQTASSVQLFYFGTFLTHREPEGGYSNPHCAKTTPLPVFWSFITCYHFGYHKEHHEYPDVPWWKLPEVYKRNTEIF